MFSRQYFLLHVKHIHTLIFLLLISALSCTQPVNALESENYRSEHWQVTNAQVLEKGQRVIADGLPQISVHAIAQDTDGLFWLGTENGLARFDGRKFEILNTINEPSLPSNWIEYLFVDDTERVWIATASGVVSYSNGVFERVSTEQTQDRITYIDQSSDGQLWFFGTSLWTLNNNKLIAAPSLQKDKKKLSAANIDGNSVWLLSANNKLIHYDVLTNTTCEYPLASEQEYSQLQVSNQRVYMLENEHLRTFQYATDGCALNEVPSLTTQKIRKLMLNDSGYPLLLGNNDRFYEITPVGGLLDMSFNQSITPSLARDAITFYQSDDLVFLGTKTNGLVVLWPSTIKREAYGQPFSNARVWSFFTTDTVYAASDVGVYKLGDDKQWQLAVPQSALDGNVAYSLLIDDGTMWIGTRNGLYSKNADTSVAISVNGFEGYQVNTIYKDANTLWFGTNNGLFKQEKDKFVEVSHFTFQAIRSIYRAKNGTLWVGTESGLYGTNAHNINSHTKWQQTRMAGIDSSFVSNITESPNGHLFVATYGDGLFQKNKQDEWNQYTTKNGLPFQNLFNVNITENRLWASGASGIFSANLSKLYKKQVQRHIVLRHDGTFASRKDVRCCNGAGNNRGVVFNNKLYYPTLEGILSVNLTEQQALISPLFISGVYQNGERLISSNSTSIIKLQNERNLEIAYTKPVFASEEPPQYRYRLSKGDSSWVYAGQREIAYFTHLPSGEFAFEVSAKLGNDEWMPASRLSISVAPYWWETWWVRSIAVFVMLYMGWLLFSVRTKALTNRNNMLKKVVEERTLAYERVNRELEQKNDVLEQVANTDHLTGLSNRRAIKDYLPKLFDAINTRRVDEKQADDVCALFLLDLDYFKRINDEFGHDKGDSVLTHVANAIKSVSRPEDCLLRWGGEEFLLIVPTVKKQSFKAFSDRLHTVLTSLHNQLELSSPLTMSAGAIWLPWENSKTDLYQWERSMLLIDSALYRVKETGRNGTALVHTSPALNDWLNWSKEGIEKAEAQAVITIERF